MAFKIPDVLKYEIQHRMERLGIGASGGSPRQWLNEHPLLIASAAVVSAVLVVILLVGSRRPAADGPLAEGKTAWFYDINTSKLFEGSSKNGGPISAPSGLTPDGEPAGYRAHVYSYVPDPNEAELFVGFLEQPDPEAKKKYAASSLRDLADWTQGHLIRRPNDKQWVRALSPEGQAILKEQVKPNKRGQTPIYQIPHDKE